MRGERGARVRVMTVSLRPAARRQPRRAGRAESAASAPGGGHAGAIRPRRQERAAMTATATRPALIQIQQRDIDGLVLCGEHGGAPYDLLAAALDVAPVRLRGITARWRRAGYAATGQVGPGPAWCWLTAAGMADTGLPYRPGPPSLARVSTSARSWPSGWRCRPARTGSSTGRGGNRNGASAAKAPMPAGTCRTPRSGGRRARRARRAGLGHRDRTDPEDRRPHRRHHGRAGRRRV